MAVEPTHPALAKKELKAAIQNAKTAEDHQRVAAYYKNEANRMLAEAKEHDELAAIYAKSPNPAAMKQPMCCASADAASSSHSWRADERRTAEHCKYFADAARKAAQASQELAKMHEEMANQAP